MENLLPLGAVALVFVLLSLKVINQYEQGLVFTFGKYTGMKHPGLRFLVPIVQRMVRVDMRIRTLDVMKQQIMSKDNVPVHVNAAIFYKVSNPEQAIIEVQDYQYAIAQYGQTALRDVIGGMNLDTLLTTGKTPSWCNCDFVSDFSRHIARWWRGEAPLLGSLQTTIATHQVVAGAGYRTRP